MMIKGECDLGGLWLFCSAVVLLVSLVQSVWRERVSTYRGLVTLCGALSLELFFKLSISDWL